MTCLAYLGPEQVHIVLHAYHGIHHLVNDDKQSSFFMKDDKILSDMPGINIISLLRLPFLLMRM